MPDHVDKIVASFQEKIKYHDDESIKLKKTINQVLDVEGRPPLYTEAELQVSGGTGVSVRADEFYNKPLATCVRTILERRQSINLGAASLDEIHDLLMSGSYDPENKKEAIVKRNIAITLSKNPVFIRLPNKTWGMRDWYGVKAPKKSSNEEVINNDSDNLPDSDDDQENNNSITVGETP